MVQREKLSLQNTRSDVRGSNDASTVKGIAFQVSCSNKGIFARHVGRVLFQCLSSSLPWTQEQQLTLHALHACSIVQTEPSIAARVRLSK